MLNKLFVAGWFCLLLTSCNSTVNKPVTEPLTPKEVSDIAENDRSFLSTYALAELQQNKLNTTVQKALWQELTYKRLHKFLKKINDPDFIEQIEKCSNDEWESLYGRYAGRVDSVSASWKEYLKQNSPEAYVNIELTGIEKQYMKSPWDGSSFVSDMQFVFTITPLRGEIERLDAYFGLTQKGETPFYTYFETTGRNHILVENPMRQITVVKVYPTLPVQIEDRAKETELGTLLSEYDFNVNIYSVKKEGEIINIGSALSNVPYSVTSLWSDENDSKDGETFRELHIGNIVEEVLNESYVSRSDYVEQQKQNAYREQDELAAAFYAL